MSETPDTPPVQTPSSTSASSPSPAFKSTPMAPPKPVSTKLAEAPAPKSAEPTKAEDPFNARFDAHVEKTLIEAGPLLKTTILFFQEYVEKFAPGQEVGGIPAADYQLRFCRILKDYIEKSPTEDFAKGWTILLGFFWRYRDGALGERYVNRFAEFWNQGDTNLKLFQRLVNLAMVSANPATRQQATKQVNVAKTVEEGLTPQAAQKILAYYKV